MLRAFFISLSESKTLRRVAERSPIGKRMSARFVAGMTVDDALRVTKEVNALGFLLGDKKSGPFKLEVEWIRVERAGASE